VRAHYHRIVYAAKEAAARRAAEQRPDFAAGYGWASRYRVLLDLRAAALAAT